MEEGSSLSSSPIQPWRRLPPFRPPFHAFVLGPSQTFRKDNLENVFGLPLLKGGLRQERPFPLPLGPNWRYSHAIGPLSDWEPTAVEKEGVMILQSLLLHKVSLTRLGGG